LENGNDTFVLNVLDGALKAGFSGEILGIVRIERDLMPRVPESYLISTVDKFISIL
jgi:hypothetical protein